MAIKATFPARIRNLLLSNTVMSLKQIRLDLGGRGRSSLFRDLNTLDVIASYTHTGQYHVLRSMAKFDLNGLWFFRGAGFSNYGTLKNTLIQIIVHAEIGMTHKELTNLLHVKVQNTLTELVKSNTLGRKLLADRNFVYLSADEYQAEDQFRRRLAMHEVDATAMALPAESIRIEIFLELIRASNNLLDEKELGPLLRGRGIAIQNTEIAHVLVHYDIKKNRL